MQIKLKMILVLILLLVPCASVVAQETEDLQLRLIELKGKEESLRLRVQQLDEDLKPENIERALAGIGSTKPEELREARRRQLSSERETVRAELKIAELTRARVETAIANAEARAYQESPLPMPTPVNALKVRSIAFNIGLIAIVLVSFVISLSIFLLIFKVFNMEVSK